MDIHHRYEGEVLIIRPLIPSLRIEEAHPFRQKLIELILESTADQVIIEMDMVSSIDSAGLGSLLAIFRFIGLRQGKLKFVALSRSLISTFAFVGMDRIFEFYPSLKEALEAISDDH